jgi:pimeloyl-ACP methyl ester carboxylesterase
MGGYYAVNQAIRAPGRIASVTFFDWIMVTTTYRVKVMLGILLLLLGRSKWLWRRTLRWWSGNVVEPLELEIAMAGISTYRAKLPPVPRLSEDQIRSIRLPVLAIFASRSILHDGALATECARNWLRYGEAELWPESGHYIADPDRFNQRVLDFVGLHTGAVKGVLTFLQDHPPRRSLVFSV